MGRLSGKVAIVTGGSAGIGEATVKRFALEGASVVFTARGEKGGQEAEQRLRQAVPGAMIEFIRADCAVKAEVEAMVEETARRHGRIDILINNAQAIPDQRQLEDVTDEDLALAFDSGLWGTIWAMQAVFPHMRKAGEGRIVNTCSMMGIVGGPKNAAYAATKEAIRGVTRVAANDWGQFGITVNVISPAAVSPAMLKWAKDNPDKVQDLSRNIPLRGGDPDDVAVISLGLISEGGQFITGETIGADGGSSFLIRQRYA